MNFNKQILKSYKNINKLIINTPLQYSERLSKKYNCNIFLKREDLQITRSFKIRGALNKIINLKNIKNSVVCANGIVCASAGNHAQGVAYATNKLNIKSDIFIPYNTPKQKINKIINFNKKSEIHLVGKTFDECLSNANKFALKYNKELIHPFDDYDIIYGQGTIGLEINELINPDIIISTIGGGGLLSGLKLSKNINTTLIGVEPKYCDSMSQSIKKKKIINVIPKNNFVDGATVSKIGKKNFNICKNIKIYTCSINEICKEIIDLHNEDGIIAEPAGVLPFTVLNKINIKNKNVVIILSGGNSDIYRYTSIINQIK